ncbi:MAG: hypothetical protein KDJ15_03975, partial [Alphaproteobacteria bacterium]|nr:hypothetical protein [Alphaproteobacteria bacterium]
VILDVYGSAPEPVRAETETKKTKTPVAPETKEISSETVEAIRKALPGGVLVDHLGAPPVAAHDEPTASPAEAEEHHEQGAHGAAPPETPLARALAELDRPAVIVTTLTERAQMAAFRRGDFVWLVFDRPHMNVFPQIAGADAASRFPPFETVPLEKGTAFRLRLPEDRKETVLRGEGGGLVWRLVMTDKAPDIPPVRPERVFAETDDVLGGTLVWPIAGSSGVLSLRDPDVGDEIRVITVPDSSQFSGPIYRFPGGGVLESPVGMAVIPRTDELLVSLSGEGVSIGSPGGLALSRPKDLSRHAMRADIQDATPPESLGSAPTDSHGHEGGHVQERRAVPPHRFKRIFDFDRWMMGGIQALNDNQNILLSGMPAKDKDGMVQDLLTLGKMNLANDRGQEAVGFLRYASLEMPEMLKSPEYLALRGGAFALAGKCGMALRDLQSPLLQPYDELDYWRAYTLACLEDWQQASQVMPSDFRLLLSYPKALQERLGLKLAEISLRNADVPAAEAMIHSLQEEPETLRPATLAGLDYLEGEAERQNGAYDQSRALWAPLTTGPDDLYRAKAGLALTMLDLQEKKIETKEAIDRLEGLRYAWRGDELEVKVNFILGKLYLEDRNYVKGFGILREAAAMSPGSNIEHDVTDYMKKTFRDLLLEDEDISPLDAVAVYEEFTELTPPGEDGNKLIQKLAERLVDAQLFDRAAALLRHQVNYRLKDGEKARVNTRLGVVSLLAEHPEDALAAFEAADSWYQTQEEDSPEAARKRYDLALLEARAISQMGRPEEALNSLNRFDPDPRVNRLKADIAWRARLWEEAAAALQDLILDEALDVRRPLTETQANLILNRAVALNLSGNRVGLANIRERYGVQMADTPRASLFDVVTRPRNVSLFTDKSAIDDLVAEVDLFQDFLAAYKQEDPQSEE